MELTSPQLVNKFAAFYGTRKLIYLIQKHPPLVPLLSQRNPFRTTSSHLIHFNIILPFMPRSSKWSISIRSSHQNPICTSPAPHSCHMPPPFPFFSTWSPEWYLVRSTDQRFDVHDRQLLNTLKNFHLKHLERDERCVSLFGTRGWWDVVSLSWSSQRILHYHNPVSDSP